MAVNSLFPGAGEPGMANTSQPQARHFEPAMSASDEAHLVGEMPGTGEVRAAMDAVIGDTRQGLPGELGTFGSPDFRLSEMTLLKSIALYLGEFNPGFVLLRDEPVVREAFKDEGSGGILTAPIDEFQRWFWGVPQITNEESLGSFFVQTGKDSEVAKTQSGLLGSPIKWMRGKIGDLREKLLVDKVDNS